MPFDGTLDHEALLQRVSALDRLLETTLRLAAETDLDRLLRLVTTEACGALSCERASLFLYDSSRDELYTRVVTELEIKEIRLPAGQGIAGWVATNRTLANVSDPPSDPRWDPSFDRRTGYHTRSIVAAPIFSHNGERLLGVIQLLNRSGRGFDRHDEHLLQAFASHAAVALERAEYLEAEQRQQEMQAALDAARRIQSHFLPRDLPQIPGYELAAWWLPAQGVAGDYYDVIPLPDGRLALIVADVTGHGIGPSLIMASARAMLHVLARTPNGAGRMLSLLSESISPDLNEGRFITFLLGTLDTRTHTMSFANAGHAPAFHLQRRTGEVRVLEPTSFPLGIADVAVPESKRPVEVEPGDLVVFATDGCIETRNPNGELYGLSRMTALFREHQALPAGQLVQRFQEALQSWYLPTSPDDDITLLVLERKNQTSRW